MRQLPHNYYSGSFWYFFALLDGMLATGLLKPIFHAGSTIRHPITATNQPNIISTCRAVILHEKEWPVFVGIHGFGSDGTACLDMWQEYADQEGYVLVCPSLGDENGGWYQDAGEKILKAVLKNVRQECRVQNKVFLAGFSAGAQFVQGFAFAYPNSVTGVAVLSSGNYFEPSSDARSVPFLVVIGDKDNPVGLRGANLFD